tara:strand:+ start:71 stop:463 length:393 start_codon:yes stop_codon:yes gene_type:complete
MTIIDTLKHWADTEIKLLDQSPELNNYSHSVILSWYFFGSCDICTQAMELDDNEFQYFYKKLLTYIGVSNEHAERTITSWMLDEISEQEYFIINQGAHGFKDFEKNPEGIGGLKLCFSEFSDKFSPKEKN